MDKCIYQISFDFSYALADISKQKEDVSSLELFDDTPELIYEFDYDWVTEDSNIQPDLILIASKLLGIDAMAFHAIESFLSEIDTVEIEVSNRKFNILSNIPKLKGVLNMRKSKITRFSTGDIMSIDSPVFLPGDYPPLFKIEETPMNFFCSGLLFDEINKNALRGWRFSLCPIRKNTWL